MLFCGQIEREREIASHKPILGGAGVLQSKPQLELEDRLRVEAEKGGVKQWLAVEGVLESIALAAGFAKKMGGNSVRGWVNHLLGFFSIRIGPGFCWVA